MMSSTFGAPLGGTTRGGHQGVDSAAVSLITPPNFGGGDGSCFPSIVVVALGEPGTPVTWADAGQPASDSTAKISMRFLPMKRYICDPLFRKSCNASGPKR